MAVFEKSEQYRKYLIQINLVDVRGYTIWGTDMSDNENDKLFVSNGRLMLFSSIKKMKTEIKSYEIPYSDIENFKKWINEENFDHVYTTNDVSKLLNFEASTLKDKQSALTILDCLNLIQDFFIQINDLNGCRFFERKHLIDLKDYIYNNFFWKKDNIDVINLNEVKTLVLLRELYGAFIEKIQII